MLLAIDVGNSTTTIGLYNKQNTLEFIATLNTDSGKTADQISIEFLNLFHLYHQTIESVTGIIVSSVVPPLNFMLGKAMVQLFSITPMVVGPGVKTGLNLRMDVQTQVGADLVAGAVSALGKFKPPMVIIDMGTATTMGVISEGQIYEGGLMLPGVNVSLEALSNQAAQLPMISLQKPKTLIGKNTVDCMQSGIVYGTAGMIDGILDRIEAQFPGKSISVVATGRNAPVIVQYCRHKIVYDKYLIMDGLLAIYRKNNG